MCWVTGRRRTHRHWRGEVGIHQSTLKHRLLFIKDVHIPPLKKLELTKYRESLGKTQRNPGKVASLRTRPVYLLFSLLFPELDAFLLSPAPHLFRIQCFVLVEIHPVVVFGRTGWRLCWQRQSKQCSQVNAGKQGLTEKLPKKKTGSRQGWATPVHEGRIQAGFYLTGRQHLPWGLTFLGESSFCLVGNKAWLGSGPAGLEWPISYLPLTSSTVKKLLFYVQTDTFTEMLINVDCPR